MSWVQLEQATGCDARGMQLILRGERTQINRTTLCKILSVDPAPEPAPGMYLDAAGPRRRLQALATLGYSCRYIAGRIRTSEARLHLIAAGKQPTVRYTLASRIAAVYSELSSTPAPPGRSRTRVIKHAADNAYAPPGAWDDIDDPNALPDWTGYCGTDRGFWTHRLQKIPGCARCEQAHEQWLIDHAHLDGRTRNKAMFAQRSTAASREAELAEDGRELLRLGADYEQAAERLGVTRNHLQQAMLRHPEPLPAAA
jgi:hypothetical protein